MNEETNSDNESDSSDRTMIVLDDVEENLDIHNPFFLYLNKKPFVINEKCLPVASVKPQIKGRDVNELQKRIKELVSIKETHEDSGVETNSNESWDEQRNENTRYMESESNLLSSYSSTPIEASRCLVKRTMSDSRLIKPNIKFYNHDRYINSMKTFEVIKRQMSHNEFHKTEFDRIVSSCRQRRLSSKKNDSQPKSILRNSQSETERVHIYSRGIKETSRIKETCVDADIEEHCTHAHLPTPKITTTWDRKTGTLSSLV